MGTVESQFLAGTAQNPVFQSFSGVTAVAPARDEGCSEPIRFAPLALSGRSNMQEDARDSLAVFKFNPIEETIGRSPQSSDPCCEQLLSRRSRHSSSSGMKEFNFLQIRQRVNNCEWLDSHCYLQIRGGKITPLLSAK